jgi:hypothetical protein
MSEVDGKPLVWLFTDQVEHDRSPMTKGDLDYVAYLFGEEAAQELAHVYGVIDEKKISAAG